MSRSLPSEMRGKTPLTIRAFVEKLQRASRTRASVERVHHIPARAAELGAFPASFPPWLVDALTSRGMAAPYAHQSDAWTALARGQDVVVTTPTASGKTLCYNVPVVQMLGETTSGCALYLYPTKALAQDQCAELNELLGAAGIGAPAHVYDGDTPADIRRRVRDAARVVLTNPDMLHQSILPHHEKWRRFFADLRYVVVDEMHTYRGVFGSHVANVLRRLRRICAHYGTRPLQVFTSATIANPEELATELGGERIALIQRSGAPSGEKLFVLYNPPIIDAELQRRQSPGAAAFRLFAPLLEAGHAGIVFTRSRQGVEILTRRLKESFTDRRRASIADRIEGYRAGYLPNDRRRIERGLREGTVLGVVSTNALELGIDIGSLDVCIIAGYPGTIAATWQQAGRAGRRATTSLSVLIAGDDPVDQFLVTRPDFFFEASPEHARVDPDNMLILADHMKCAVFELPFGTSEAYGGFSVADTQEIITYLSEQLDAIVHAEGAWRWSGEGYPATAVSLRNIHDENFVIIDTTRPKPEILGEIDFEAAHTTVYENAIYQHSARLYEVHRLDYPVRKAYVREVDIDYFTQAIDQRRVFLLDVEEEQTGRAGVGHGWGEVRVVTRFVGYKKLRFKTMENLGYGEILLPDLEKHTTSFWVSYEADALYALGLSAVDQGSGLLALSNVLRTVASVSLMCTRDDLLVSVQGRDDGEAWTPTGLEPVPTPIESVHLQETPSIFLYDRTPGGVGFSERLFDLRDALFAEARRVIEACGCEAGCPACVGPPEQITVAGKAAARAILGLSGA